MLLLRSLVFDLLLYTTMAVMGVLGAPLALWSVDGAYAVCRAYCRVVFFYLRVIVLMYFSEPVGDGPTIAVPSILTTVVIALGFAVTVALGILPGPVLDLAGQAGSFIR